MRRLLLAVVVVVLAMVGVGCLIDRSPLGGNTGIDVGTERPDAWLPETTDAPPSDANTDAWLDPTIDAWEPDAFTDMPDAWAPDAWLPTTPDAWAPDACTAPHCEGNELVDCSGSRVSCVACGTTPAMTTPHCLTLVPSNTPAGYAVSTDRSAIDAVFDGNTFQWNTTSCMRGQLRTRDGELHGSQVERAMVSGVEVCIVDARRFVLESGTHIVVEGALPLVLVAGESFEMPAGATITVGSWNDSSSTDCSPDITGPGALVSGPGTGAAGAPAASGNGDGGGGGGGFCGSGGNGGGGMGSAPGGGGGPSTASTLVPLRGGAPGGGGSAGGSGIRGSGFGGMGGGALQISAPVIDMHGVIEAFGANGGAGSQPDSNSGSGGGGGSGGGVHLEALVLNTGGGLVDVRGGGGGGASCMSSEGQCGGLDARPAALSGGMGAGSCGGNGGVGAAATAAGGGMGEVDFNGGGGGGGAGCVVLRQYGTVAPTIAATPSAAGIVSVAPPTVL